MAAPMNNTERQKISFKNHNDEVFCALQFIGFAIRSFLGPVSVLKSVIEEDSDESVMVSGVNELLKSIDIQHPLASVVSDFSQAHHEAFGTGTTTLVNLITMWLSAVRSSNLSSAVPARIICLIIDEILDVCVSYLDTLSIPLKFGDPQGYGTDTGDPQGYGTDTVPLSESEKTSDILDDDDNAEDVSWYFNGRIPKPPTPPAVDRLYGVDTPLVPTNGLTIVGAENLRKTGAPANDSETKRRSEVIPSSSSSHDSDDEFDWWTDDKTTCDINNTANSRTELTNGCSKLPENPPPAPAPKTTRNDIESLLARKLKEKASVRCSAAMVHSRHMTTAKQKVDLKPNLTEKDDAGRVTATDQDPCVPPAVHDGLIITDIYQLCDGLAHGLTMEMSLIKSVLSMAPNGGLNSSRGNAVSVMLLDLTTCLRVVGPSSRESCVRPGVVFEVTETTADTTERLTRSKRGPYKILLINGGVTSTGHHHGYKQNYKQTVTGSIEEGVVDRLVDCRRDLRDEGWLSKSCQHLNKLEADVVLVQGPVSDQLIEACCNRSILVLSHISSHTLRVIEQSTTAQAVSYISDSHKRDLGEVKSIQFVEAGWCKGMMKGSVMKTYYLTLSTTESVNTVILTGSCTASVAQSEQAFLTSVRRLRCALNDGKVLPGAGVVEWKSIKLLRDSNNLKLTFSDLPCVFPSEETELYTPLLVNCIVSGWMDYLSVIMINSGLYKDAAECRTEIEARLKMEDPSEVHGNILHPVSSLPDHGNDPGIVVYDCFSAKVQAWRSAIACVNMCLQSDMFIVTGLGDHDASHL